MPRAWALAAWVTCGLVWSLGLATIGLAVAGRVPPPRFVTTFAVAVFRFQLYDIDRLLNRTLVYALVTAS